MKKLTAVVAAGAMVATSAQAGCWSKEEASAAGVRQLQSMLMVSALRCQAAGQGIMGEYNAFVTANRTAIGAENDRIRAHFIRAAGAVAGQRAYDSFTTSMANGYGGGAGAPQSCADVAALAHEAASMQNSRDGLLLMVDQLGLQASLPEGRCEMAAPAMVMASATPVRAPAAVEQAAFAAAPASASAPAPAIVSQTAAPTFAATPVAYDPR